MQKLSREDVRNVYCAECGAAPGSPCKSYCGPRKGKERTANHQSRVNLAYRMITIAQ